MRGKKRILIVRGWKSKREHWKEVVEILQKNGFEILIPDLPGVSKETEEVKKAWSIEDYKNWVLNYAKDHHWNKFNLLGHSFGGAIAAKIAAQEPKKVEKLILCAPAVVGTKSPKTILFYLTAQAIKAIFSLPKIKNKFPRVKEKLSRHGIKDYYFESGVKKKILKKAAKENHKKNLLKIKKETLILWGEKDDKISFKYAKEIKETIKNAKIVILKSVNHSPHREKPEEFLKEIIKFLG